MTSGWVQPVKLTDEQRDMMIRTLSEYRNPKLKHSDVQEQILHRIEGALTYLATVSENSETHEPFDRVSEFSRSIHGTLQQIERLKEYERNNFELLGCDIDRLQSEMQRAAAAAVRVMAGVKLGQGEKYGTPEQGKARFFAYQLGDFWCVHLQLPTGENSAFRKFLHVVCDQVGLEVLGRAALDGVLNSADKPAR